MKVNFETANLRYLDASTITVNEKILSYDI